MVRMRSRDKRKARKAKQSTRSGQHLSASGLALTDSLFRRAERIDRDQFLSAAQVTDIMVATRLALTAMVNGDSTENDCGMISGQMDFAVKIAEQGTGIDHIDIFERAQDACVRAVARGKETGRWRFDGPGLQDVRIAVDLFEQLCSITKLYEFDIALERVEEAMNEGNTITFERVAA
ncbi:hypothetical protein [Undibacterium macrobrachii]|uniref:Uncharacterized protein n=1 Tax=Undibacterium macrobrachii TaxID=1119058 RepID=A0ABQ2X6H1_9BURK|nr:hypothetical protein [Undibacterium macrobrachii]GGX01642.1 hypothetical protein GCM10011282_04480 [Undibacterium macrobrachii]